MKKIILSIVLVLTTVLAFSAVKKGIELREGEVVIKKVAANHMVGITAVSGKLYLTNQRIYFKSGKLNFIKSEWSVELDKIEEISKRKIPQQIKVRIKGEEKSEILAFYGRKKWIPLIEKEIKNFINQ